MKSSPILFAILILASACFLGPALYAQSGGTGALTVTVTDPSGGVIVGAKVTINNGGAVTRSQITAGNGNYTFTLLTSGVYEVAISAAGFQSVTVPGVAVDVTETKVLNQVLQLGAQTQQVTVNGATENIQTETSALGGVVNEQSLVSIPLATRNYTQILNLSPGVLTSVTDASSFGRGSQAIYVNGHDDASNSYLMDGVQVSSYSGSTTGRYGRLVLWIRSDPQPGFAAGIQGRHLDVRRQHWPKSRRFGEPGVEDRNECLSWEPV